MARVPNTRLPAYAAGDYTVAMIMSYTQNFPELRRRLAGRDQCELATDKASKFIALSPLFSREVELLRWMNKLI